MNGIAVVIGMLALTILLLQLLSTAAIAYFVYMKYVELEPLTFVLPGPGEPFSKGQLIIPPDRAQEFIKAMATENVIVHGPDFMKGLDNTKKDIPKSESKGHTYI